MQAITQGAIGADRVDFMLRDGYYAGTHILVQWRLRGL